MKLVAVVLVAQAALILGLGGAQAHAQDYEQDDDSSTSSYNFDYSSSSSGGSSESQFEDYFVHKVMHFEGNDDDEIDSGADQEEKVEPYKLTDNWQKGWRKYPLYIVILGGFRWDYFSRYETTNLTSFSYLAKHGTLMPMVKPVFPPEDFPVWTSMATGQYPEGHNIIGDVMFNLKTRTFFDRQDTNSTRTAEWWKAAEPFWSTAATYGRKVAMINWHDCFLPGKSLENPENCRPFELRRDGHIQSRSEIAVQLSEAFTGLYKGRYDVAVVYTDMIRRTAELYGPGSEEMHRAVHDLDDLLQARLIDARSKAQGGKQINFMVLSDYGMTADDDLQPIYLDQYLDLYYIQYVIVASGYAQITPYALEQEKILSDLRQIKEGVNVYMSSQLTQYDADVVPDELHYGKGEWAQDILIIVKPAYQFVINETDPKIIVVPGSAEPDEFSRARASLNPYFVEPPYPKIPKKQRKNLPPELKKKVQKYDDYQKHKWDMNVVGFAMGPDFREDYITYEPVEVIPSGTHSGSWSRIESMLTISGASPVTPLQSILLLISTVLTTLIIPQAATNGLLK